MASFGNILSKIYHFLTIITFRSKLKIKIHTMLLRFIFIHLLGIATLFVANAQATFDCNPGTQQKFLEANNVRALVTNKNLLWFDNSEIKNYYEVPKHNGDSSTIPKNTLFMSNVWLSAFGENEQLKVAAAGYSLHDFDFYPGPIDNAATDLQTCNACDKLFEVTSSEIEEFLSDGLVSQNMVEYPAKNNPHLINEIGAALPEGEAYFPFNDVNNDGHYNPYDGDYPLITGDQSIHWILNDIGNLHNESGGEILGIELKSTAYAYNIEELDTVTFYRFEVTNKSNEALSDFIFGFDVDPDLGEYLNDYSGIDLASNTAYCYNANDYDPGDLGYGHEIPIVGVTFLDVPYAVEENESKLASFMNLGITSLDNGHPSLPHHFYNNLTAKFQDGQHLTWGGDGTSPGEAHTNYMFPSAPNDNSDNAWNECGNEPGNRVFIMAAKPISLAIGETVKYEIAVVSTFKVNYPCPDISGLLESVETAQSFYDTQIKTELLSTNLENENPIALQTTLFPNPIADFIEIESAIQFEEAEVYDVQGRKVLSDFT